MAGCPPLDFQPLGGAFRGKVRVAGIVTGVFLLGRPRTRRRLRGSVCAGWRRKLHLFDLGENRTDEATYSDRLAVGHRVKLVYNAKGYNASVGLGNGEWTENGFVCEREELNVTLSTLLCSLMDMVLDP